MVGGIGESFRGDISSREMTRRGISRGRRMRWIMRDDRGFILVRAGHFF